MIDCKIANSEILDGLDVQRMLRDRIAQSGSQIEFAMQHGLHPSTVSLALSGRRDFPQSILDALGLYVRYMPIKRGK